MKMKPRVEHSTRGIPHMALVFVKYLKTANI